MKNTKNNELQDNKEIETRLNVSQSILDLSYRLISHYDAKTNQLLTLIGFDFLIISVVFTAFLTNFSTLSQINKITVIVFVFSNLFSVVVSILMIRLALIPHVHTVVKTKKPKYGLFYFKDVVSNLDEENYVKVLLGKSRPTESEYYDNKNETYSFEKCIIEDCARDIFAHSEILSIKTKYVKYAFNAATISIIFLVFSLLCIALVFMFL
ncbi:MAG: hypothetical protein UZ04_CHB001001660 [Chlorobi bacterium OLB4]|nr:MAG: hypothetical protein UZ04_CHB001001660 [Chlorobi bacterium OLB4]MBW7855147.1 hypothetical protein [Ignavibacteria bacterium]